MNNLDFIAAESGLKLGHGIKENAGDIDAAIDILHRHGIYAMFLWLHENKGGRKNIGSELDRFLNMEAVETIITGAPSSKNEINFYGGNNVINALDNVRNYLTGSLYTMFFIKDLLDRMLTYARHTAKIKMETVNGK